MKCKEAERWVLLSDSGELPPRKLARLERHLEQCPDCAAFRDDLKRIAQSARRALPAEQPGPAALAAIMRAARERLASGRPPRRPLFARGYPAAAGVLALAASLLVCAGLWHMLREQAVPPGAPTAPGPAASISVETPASSPESLEDLAATTWSEAGYVERISDLQRRSDITLAEKELMILDGLAI